MTTTVLPLLSSGGYQNKLSASESVSIPTHPASPPALPVPDYFVCWGPTAYGVPKRPPGDMYDADVDVHAQRQKNRPPLRRDANPWHCLGGSELLSAGAYIEA